MKTLINESDLENQETKEILEIMAEMPSEMKKQLFWYARGLMDQSKASTDDSKKEPAA